MLLLSRGEGEVIYIGEGENRIAIKVMEVCKYRGMVRLAFEAPKEVKIQREELLGRDVVAEIEATRKSKGRRKRG